MNNANKEEKICKWQANEHLYSQGRNEKFKGLRTIQRWWGRPAERWPLGPHWSRGPAIMKLNERERQNRNNSEREEPSTSAKSKVEHQSVIGNFKLINEPQKQSQKIKIKIKINMLTGSGYLSPKTCLKAVILVASARLTSWACTGKADWIFWLTMLSTEAICSGVRAPDQEKSKRSFSASTREPFWSHRDRPSPDSGKKKENHYDLRTNK